MRLVDARALVLARSGAASPAAPASAAPLRNVRRLVLFDETAPSGGWSIPDAAFTIPPDYALITRHTIDCEGTDGWCQLNRTHMWQMDHRIN